jgi:DNA-binding LacI/PurR family transcriptional regulator
MGKKFKNKDLASKLGVSSTLVSLVLNNKADQHGIRKDTQERVLALARQMGFFDLPPEREKVRRRAIESERISPVEATPGVIGMIVSSLHNPFIYEIAPYLQKAFSSIGIGFSIITKDPDDQRYNRLIAAFRKFYSGLILVGEAADDLTIRTLRVNDYPLVLLEKNLSNLRLNTVTTDNKAGAVLMAAHIEKLGYKNVLILTDQKTLGSDNHIIHELKSLFLQQAGMNKPLVEDIRMPLNIDDFDSSFLEKYLRPPYRIDIIVTLHAELVYPVMAALQKKRIRIPQDMALVSMEEGIGFDLLNSPVTSLKKPLSGMALKTANMIWTEVKNAGRGKYKRQVAIAPELVVRKSCGTL